MSCDNDTELGSIPEQIPENIFAGGEWEYKNFNGDILQVYIKISITKNEFTVYKKIDNTNTVAPGIYENTTIGTYSLFYEEMPNPAPELGPAFMPSIKFVSDNQRMNGTATWTFSDSDTSLVFFNESGDCTLIIGNSMGWSGYKFTPVNNL
jgi:hypothetical protein